MVKQLAKISIIILILFYYPASVHSQLWKSLTKKERPTFFEVQKVMNQFYHSMKEGRKPGFKQFKRWEWFARDRLNKDGYLDPALNWKGWLEKEERFGPASDAKGSWTPLGPAIMPGLSGLGRLNCIEFDPQNTDIIWVGAPTGGLWKSVDGGQTWTTNTDGLPNLGVSDILIHPGNPDIMYIATGDKQRGSALSLGIMKSLDGGETWQFTGLNPDVTEKCKIGKMLMHPDNPEIILAAANKGVYKTTDEGDTWEKKVEGDFFDIEVHPNHSSIWYASRAATGVYRSMDAGETWTRLTDGLPNPGPDIGRIAIAVSQSSPGVLYAVYCQDVVSQGWVWGLYGIYRSGDGGNTWTLQANSPNLLGWSDTGDDTGGQGGYALIMDVNPENPNEVYVGSVNIWKSRDGGVTWQIISTSIHVDHHDFAFLPGSSTTIFACHDGGLHKSTNNGTRWTDLSSGLGIHQVYRLAISPQDPNQVIIGAQDNGSSLLNRAINWRAVYGGDGTVCMIDPGNNSNLYCSWQFGHLLLSTNGGWNFYQIFYRNGAWITPFAINPFDPATLYAATDYVYMSTNRGSTWEGISSRLSGELMRILKLAPSTTGCIYVSDGSRIFKTINTGNNWTELNTDEFPTFITDIAIHPHNHEILWVTIGGYGRWNSRFTWFNIPYEIDKPKVFYSENSGITWTDVSGQLPNIPANCLAIDPYSLGVYVGTDLGVFYSASGQGDWQRFDNGLPNVIVTDMAIQKTAAKIVAGTYGRGVWESLLVSNPVTPGIYPPLHFTGGTAINQSLFRTEYINILSWEANPLNNNIVHYRLYRVSGGSRTLVAETDANTFSYWERGVNRGIYRYILAAVDGEGYESDPVYLTVHVK
ncbi:MAG: hypothetical protein JSV88_27905 [Candidatus Aminicenantes bacterium]|nr:MAG: hypothetical protein JSV88_27905 [Candidatus Aminicenantes bacterium]